MPESLAAAPDVLLIIRDTVRAASLYGYERETTPTLARLAADGVTFERAYSTAPWTEPSHASLLTGGWTPELSADWRSPLNGEPRTLAHVLASFGYRTGGFTANTFSTARESGLERGFSHYDDYHVWSPVLPRGERVATWVSLRDMPATILEVPGLREQPSMPGASLTRHLGALANTRVDTLLSTVSYASGNHPQYPVSRGDMRRRQRPRWRPCSNGWRRRARGARH